MSTGHFINFYLPFKENGVGVSYTEQAKRIIAKAQELIKNGAPGVAITYSANYGQTLTIEKTYAADDWNTHTSGGNQAMVMVELEQLLGSTDQSLQGLLQIAPITTMNGGGVPESQWDDAFHTKVVTQDLDRIDTQLRNGWDILGWQHQGTINDPTHPYAVGGGYASGLPDFISDNIQQALIGFAKAYPVLKN